MRLLLLSDLNVSRSSTKKSRKCLRNTLLFYALVCQALLTVHLGWAIQGQYVIPYKDRSGKQLGSFAYKESHALVIGISDYRGGWPRLFGVKEDVKAVAETLGRLGFHVVVKEDLNEAELESAYKEFILQYGLDPENRLLFYFAGHGHTIKPSYARNDPAEWRGVLVSRDAPLPNRNAEGFRSNTLSIEQFANMAREIEARHVLFLFDSCFSGARGFALSVATLNDLTSTITNGTSEAVRQFISAGSADQPVPDSSEFRRQFVAALDGGADRNGDGYVTGSELGLFLQEKVTAYSQGMQTPQYGKIFDSRLDKGDFVFPLSAPSISCVSLPPPASVKHTFVDRLGMEFVLIPAGEFTMGAEEAPAVRPAHKVTIREPFYLGKYEVTQSQWMTIMNANPSQFRGDPLLPVENVSWEDAQEFIRQLNLKNGSDRYRLPTEAEWEYAARSCVNTAYGFGNDSNQLNRYAWYDENAEQRTHAVGLLLPNSWGLYDIHGNVWEWCQDWYGDYPSSPVVDPQGPLNGALRVYRGGGWYRGVSPFYCQLISRQGARPYFRHPALGFRLAMTIPHEKFP